MSTNRLFTMFFIAALIVVVALSISAVSDKNSSTFEMDSATRSYIAWGKALQDANKENFMMPVTGGSNTHDPVIHPYIGWADACGVDLSYANNVELDSATRSFISWAKSVQCGNVP